MARAQCNYNTFVATQQAGVRLAARPVINVNVVRCHSHKIFQHEGAFDESFIAQKFQDLL